MRLILTTAALALTALPSFAQESVSDPRAVAAAALSLSARVQALEQRVTALEQRAGIPSPTATQAAPAAPQATFYPAPQWVDPGVTYAPQTYAPAFAAPLYTSFGSGGGCVTNADGSVTCGAGAAGGRFVGFRDGPVRRFLRR